MLRSPILVVAALSMLCGRLANSAEDPRDGIKVEPQVLDTTDGSGSVLGVAFTAKGTLKERNLDSDDFDFEHARLGGFSLKYEASGTIAASQERNPKDFVNGSLTADYLLSRKAGAVLAGGFVKYETTQGFDDKESVVGLHVTLLRLGVLGQGDWVALSVNRGRVNPKEDTERQAALGTTELPEYYRTDLEFEYLYPFSGKLVQNIEFNYRYFAESSPSPQIVAAGLDRRHLITYRIGLPRDFFVAYSVGALPFDKKNEQIFQLGLSYKLK
jgi:hypothetical protein